MNYNELVQCCSVAEDFFAALKITKSDTAVSLVHFQRGVNAPLEKKLRLTTYYHNTDIAFEVVPKRSEPDAPAADVVEVKHGEWVILGDCDFKCPECGFRFTSPDDISMFKFCRCGLKMDRKEGTEE